MVILQVYQRQLEVARQKFGDIVSEGEILYTESKEPLKLRLSIVDGSIVDVFYSSRGKYSYHWDRPHAVLQHQITMKTWGSILSVSCFFSLCLLFLVFAFGGL